MASGEMRGQVPLGDKIGGVERELPDRTVAGQTYMEDRPREVSDWVRGET